jgi:hypothetical protein
VCDGLMVQRVKNPLVALASTLNSIRREPEQMNYKIGDLMRCVLAGGDDSAARKWASTRAYNVGIVVSTQTKYLGHAGIEIRWNSGLITQHRRTSTVIAKLERGENGT